MQNQVNGTSWTELWTYFGILEWNALRKCSCKIILILCNQSKREFESKLHSNLCHRIMETNVKLLRMRIYKQSSAIVKRETLLWLWSTSWKIKVLVLCINIYVLLHALSPSRYKGELCFWSEKQCGCKEIHFRCTQSKDILFQQLNQFTVVRTTRVWCSHTHLAWPIKHRFIPLSKNIFTYKLMAEKLQS